MTKEELRKSLDFVNEEREKLQQENDELQDYINKLQASKDFLDKDDKELQQRIDKAIEYIEKHRKVYKLGVNQETDEFDYISTSPQVLLNILRGDKE